MVPYILWCDTVSLCKWFLTFWDVILCYCASSSLHFVMWHCVIVQVVPDILRCDSVSLCKWFLTFCNVTLCHCASGSWHFKMWFCVIVQVVPYILWYDTVSFCKWSLTFWDVSLCHCASSVKWFLTFRKTGGFIIRVKHCLTLMIKVSGTFKMSETPQPMTQHVAEDMHPHCNVPLSSI